MTPTGFGLLDIPRITGRGGGIIGVPHFTTFECLVLNLSTPCATVIATVYRSPRPNTEFLSEFADLLTILCLKFRRVVILGDFNIHVDQKANALAKDFLSLLDCYNFKQFVDFPTHCKGHTLDLVIANDDLVSSFSSVDVGLSDRSAVFFNLSGISCK